MYSGLSVVILLTRSGSAGSGDGDERLTQFKVVITTSLPLLDTIPEGFHLNRQPYVVLAGSVADVQGEIVALV